MSESSISVSVHRRLKDNRKCFRHRWFRKSTSCRLLWGSDGNEASYVSFFSWIAFQSTLHSHQEPMMRSTPNEFSLFGKGSWDYTINAANINKFWLEGTERARPFESVYTIGMRGFGDCKLVLCCFQLLWSWTSSAAIWNYGHIFAGECDRKPDSDLANCVQYYWCLYDSANLDFVSVSTYFCIFLFSWLFMAFFLKDKEVEGYYEDGMRVPDYVTLLWTDDK